MQVKIVKKNIKNIYLRIKKNGEIVLSAPNHLSDSEIILFLKRKEKWIEKHLEKIESNKNIIKYINGDRIELLGKKFNLILFDSDSDKIRIIKNCLRIYTKHPKNSKLVEEIVYKWYYKIAQNVFVRIIKKFEHKIKRNINSIKIKAMNTRWGSCNHKKGYINLNLNLIKKPIPAIEYVILHELAHLEHPNHSKDFYNYIESFMPDWKERKKLLK